MKKHARFFSLLLASALTAGLSAPALAANGQEYYLKTTVTVEGGLRSGLKTEVSQGFAIASRVFRGDQSGALNWDDTLTRAEAVTMIIRLMGLAEEAQAAASRPCPFTDVPTGPGAMGTWPPRRGSPKVWAGTALTPPGCAAPGSSSPCSTV